MTITSETPTETPSMAAQFALQRFIEQERVRLTLARKEKALLKALSLMDTTDNSADLAWYYRESQKIIDANEVKAAAENLSL